MCARNVSHQIFPVRHPQNRRIKNLWGHLKYGLTACVSFLVAVTLLHPINSKVMPVINIKTVSPKYSYYQAHKDEYNALFFGSSRTYNHVIPQQFDHITNAAGIDTHSFNFGISAMFDVEGAAFLERVLRHPPKHLKRVFIEFDLYDAKPFAALRSPRFIYWHNWKNTQLAAQYILRSDSPQNEKNSFLSAHLLGFLYHQLNLGLIANRVVSDKVLRWTVPSIREGQGFYASPGDDNPARQAFTNNIPAYLKEVEALRVWQPQKDKKTGLITLSKNKVMLIQHMCDIVQTVGAEIVFVEHPAADNKKPYTTAQQIGLIDRVLSYRDPNKFPQLYRIDQRFDRSHLTGEGAQVFTQLLAHDFVKLTKR